MSRRFFYIFFLTMSLNTTHRLPEFNVLSMTFLPIEGDDSYHLAILHQDALKNLQLITRDLEPGKDDWAISSFPSTALQPTAINKKLFPFPEDNIPCLIPVPPVPDEEEDEAREFLGGVLVGGGTKILLYELASERKRAKQKGKRERLEKMKADAAKAKSASAKQLERDARRRKPTASVEWPWGEVTAWCGVETDLYYNSRFFIGDSYGNLSLLSTDSVKDIGLLLIPLGVTSSATTIAYLSNQALFLGSHLGDSQLITISQVPSLDEPIPPIPTKIKTVDKMSIGSLSRRKGKQRASEDDMDVDDADQEVGGQGYVVTPDGSYVKVLESFKNIGPIIDAAMVDIDGSGQVRRFPDHIIRRHLTSSLAAVGDLFRGQQHRIPQRSSEWERVPGASFHTRAGRPHRRLGRQISFRGQVSTLVRSPKLHALIVVTGTTVILLYRPIQSRCSIGLTTEVPVPASHSLAIPAHSEPMNEHSLSPTLRRGR